MDPNMAGPGGEDPISKSSLVRGIIACCICWLPIGNIVAIFLGISAMKRAKMGREAIEASGGTMRGKGAYIAGKICGIVAIASSIFMTLYYLLIVFGMLMATSRSGY